MKTEILYGLHPVCEALRAGRRTCIEIFIAKDNARFPELIPLVQPRRIPVHTVTAGQLSALSGSEAHQGIAAKVSEYPLVEMEALSGAQSPCFLLLLDGIVDPQNMGALIRTALCAGAGGVVFPKDRSASPIPSVSKASAGAMEHMKMARTTNLTAAIQSLKQDGVWIAGLDRTANQSIYDMKWTGPSAVVIGGEEKGIRPLVRKHCDFLVSIPQEADFNSLNASAAGAVVMYEVLRQRKAANAK